jgi:nucleoside-diphosphate-sugar epimerase
VLVTGATGFVGHALCDTLVQSGCFVRAALRSDRGIATGASESIVVGNHDSRTDWQQALDGIDCVVHAAARVHVLHDSPANADLYREINVRGTQRLAAECVRAGVRRFIYLSSIKVNGEETSGQPFTAAEAPRPLDDYGISKWQAEQALSEIAAGSRMTTIAIRPPLVYGPRVRANFLRLMSWVYNGIPLPLGAVANARSMVSIWNLCDLIRCSTAATALPASVLLVSDGVDLSTPELIRKLAVAMDRPARLMALPVTLLKMGGQITGKSAEIGRLVGSLQVDISATRQLLNWTPPLSVDAGLARTAHWFLRDRNARAA